MSARTAFVLVSAAVLAFFLFTIVIQPAVARGGWAELAFLAAAVAVALIVERWLRTR